MLFETDDLILRKNEKHVIFCLLEVARRGAKFGKLKISYNKQNYRPSCRKNSKTQSSFHVYFYSFSGMLAPMLVQMERQIDREIAADNKANGVTYDFKSETLGTMTEQRQEYDDDSDDEEDYNEPMLMYGPQPQIITNDLKSLDEMVSNQTHNNQSVEIGRLCYK